MGEDALKIREWALAYSPAVLKGKAAREWESLAAIFLKRVSPFLVERWRAGVFGEETDQDLRRYDNEFKHGLIKGRMAEELMLVFTWAERLGEELGVPIVCHLPPYKVPVDHAHLFDLLPNVIHRSFEAATADDSQLKAARDAFDKVRDARPPSDLISGLTAIRPFMDLAVPGLLRATQGHGIHNEFARHWIVFNTRMAHKAVDVRDQRAARESIEKLFAALIPSELTGERPNAAGLAIDYDCIRKLTGSILRKKHRNPMARSQSLREKLPQFDRSVIDRFAGLSPRKFALELLATRYGLKSSYVWRLVKRGNLYLKITARWHESLHPKEASSTDSSQSATSNTVN